jgi:hypothetical protein
MSEDHIHAGFGIRRSIMLAQCVTRRLAITFLLVVFTVGFAGRAGAQVFPQLAPLEELKANRSKHYTQLSKLKNGQEKPNASDKDALEAEARYLVYRFSLPPIFGEQNKGILMYQREFTEFIDQLERPENKKGNREFVRQFCPVLKDRCNDLLAQDMQVYRIAIVNFAPMLPQAARLKDEAIGNYLADILAERGDKGPNMHDAVRLYAARGLREFFPAVTLDATPLAAADVKRRDRDVRYVDALVKFIERKTGDKLSEPEQNGIRYLRREAIESLALAQSPAILLENNKVEGPIAPTLLRVLSPKGGLVPEPGLPERVEAAIGVCQLNYAKSPNYYPETGFYLVGTLVKDFCTAFNKDLAKNPKLPEMTWRIQAKRLELALKDLTKYAKNHTHEAHAKKVADNATLLLKSVQTFSQVNQNELQLFSKMLTGIPVPPSDYVYKGNKTYIIERE